MTPFGGIYRGRRVLITGHTGFKGSWLSLWLDRLGAEVTGLSIDVPTTPSLFEISGVARRVDSRTGDVRDGAALRVLVEEVRPEIVFHLAAQPLARRSHAEPALTVDTNVMGTVNILEAAMAAGRPSSIVAVTSDKRCRNNSLLQLTQQQIERFEADAQAAGIGWALARATSKVQS